MLKKIAVFVAVAAALLRAGGFAKDLNWQTVHYADGFTLITLADHSHPSASVHLFVAVGSVDETSKLNGISHLCEHLFFKGTPTRTAEQMKSEIENYGGAVNGQTNRDYTEFQAEIPGIYADKAVDLLMDGFLNADFPPVEFEKERNVVIDEVEMDAEESSRNLDELFQKTIYAVHPYGLPIAGSPAGVSRITRADAMKWRQTYYVPSNATLVVAGDVDPEKIKAQVADILKNAKGDPFTPPVFAQERPKTAPVVKIIPKEVDEDNFDLGYLVAGLDTPEDIYPLDVMTFMLGYGRLSWLTREIHDNLHLATSISADFLTEKYPGTLQIQGSCPPENLDAVREKILEILAKIKKGEIPPDEIERAKTLLSGVYDMGDETDSGRADTIGFYASMGNADFAKNYLARIQAVTPKDIMRVADKYLGNDYVEIVYSPKPRANASAGAP